MKLYEIQEKISSCIKINDTDAVDTETGEIIDIEELEKLEITRNEKIEGLACWYKSLCAEEKALKDEASNLTKRAGTVKNKAESIKNFLSNFLNGEKFKTTRVNITYRKSESVVIDDIKQIKNDYLKYAEPTVNKTEIKKAIKAGEEIKGARLEVKNNIGIK